MISLLMLETVQTRDNTLQKLRRLQKRPIAKAVEDQILKIKTPLNVTPRRSDFLIQDHHLWPLNGQL